MIPYESDFITMLVSEGKKTELVIIDEYINENTDDDSEDETEPKRPGPPFIYVIPHKHPRI